MFHAPPPISHEQNLKSINVILHLRFNILEHNNKYQQTQTYILDYSPSIVVFEIKRKGQKTEKTPAVGVGLQSVWTGASQGIFIARQTLPDNCFGKTRSVWPGTWEQSENSPSQICGGYGPGWGRGERGGHKELGGGGVRGVWKTDTWMSTQSGWSDQDQAKIHDCLIFYVFCRRTSGNSTIVQTLFHSY